MNKFAKKYMDMKHDKRKIIADAYALYYGTEIDDHSLTTSDNAQKGSIIYDDWIRIPGNLR